MKLAVVLGALLVITTPVVFAATPPPPDSASTPKTCSFAEIPAKTVEKCDSQLCTFEHVSNDEYGKL